MYTTIENLSKVFDEDIAKRINEVIEDSRELSDYVTFTDNREELSQRFPHTYDWVRQCLNMPSEAEIRLSMINEIIGGYGTEALDEDPNWFPYPRYSYVNMGDPYVTTIMFDHEQSRFFVACWGDIAERFQTEEA